MGSTVTSVRHKEHQWQHNERVATAESGGRARAAQGRGEPQLQGLVLLPSFSQDQVSRSLACTQTTRHQKAEKGSSVWFQGSTPDYSLFIALNL